MKTFLKLSIVTLGFAAAAVPAANAAQREKAGPRAERPLLRDLAPDRPAVRARLRARAQARLDLSADQVAALKAKRADVRSAVKDLRADTSLAAEQKRAQIRDTVRSARAEMRANLTPAQQDTLKQMRQNARRLAQRRAGR